MRFFLAIVLVATAVSAISPRERSRLALQNPDLFQGDILGIDPDDKNVIPHQNMRWTNAQVPYVLDNSVANQRALILSAMQDYHSNTCVRFVPRTTQTNYIKVFSGQGCYSYVGMINRGMQEVSLGNGCMYRGTIVHEFGHALGFYHEQNRSDRDQYLIIYWDNITKGMESQFSLLAPNQNLLLTPFDHGSIMLYGNYAFSKDRQSLTMVARNGQKLLEPYERSGMTSSDIQRIRRMYC